MPLLTENDLRNKPKGEDKNTGRLGVLHGVKRREPQRRRHTAGPQKTAKDDDVFIMLTITQN